MKGSKFHQILIHSIDNFPCRFDNITVTIEIIAVVVCIVPLASIFNLLADGHRIRIAKLSFVTLITLHSEAILMVQRRVMHLLKFFLAFLSLALQ